MCPRVKTFFNLSFYLTSYGQFYIQKLKFQQSLRIKSIFVI